MPEHHRGKRPPNYGRTFKPEPLTRAEATALLAAFSRRGSAGIRNIAMAGLMLYCGPRVSEALRAPLHDLSLEEGTFYIRHPKRDRRGRGYPRTVGVPPEASALLERWLTRRRTLGIGPRAPLFCQIQQPCRGEPMAASGFREALKDAAERAGIAKRVHPHGLRHTFAYLWLVDGKPLGQLMAALGHRNLGTTHTYTARHLPQADVIDLMRAGDAWRRSVPSAPIPGADLRELLRALLREELGAGGVPDLLEALAH
jgi:integrase